MRTLSSLKVLGIILYVFDSNNKPNPNPNHLRRIKADEWKIMVVFNIQFSFYIVYT